jgi:hypothetical protein
MTAFAPAIPTALERATVSQAVAARDPRADHLKAAAIVAVVAIHAGMPFSPALRFCVPIFIAIWAFYFARGLQRLTPNQHWQYVRSRFAKLFTCYAFWTAIYLILFHKADWATTSFRNVATEWLGGSGWPGQYFFIILFQLIWLMPLLHRIRPRHALAACALFAAFNVVSNHFLFKFAIVEAVRQRAFVYWLPYVLLGIAFANGFDVRRRWLVLPAVIALAIAPLESQASAHYLAASVTTGSICLLLAFAPTSTRDRAVRATNIDPFRSSYARVVEYVGAHTLPIYVCNPLMLYVLYQVGVVPPAQLAARIAYAAIVTTVVVAMSLSIARAMQRLGLGRFVGN